MVQLGGFSTVVDVVVYVSSVANPTKHARKIQCLESFAQGVKASGDTVLVEWNYRYTPSRLAVMLGWATTNTGGPNITLRKQIIAEQRRHGFQTMCIDASCFKYLDNHGSYLRYSLDGPFYDKAQYANRGASAAKWQQISHDLGIVLKPQQQRPQGHILICMQRDGGFAMKTLDPIQWLREKINYIRAYTQRPIVVRPHPGAWKHADFAEFTHKHFQKRHKVTVIDPSMSTLLQDLAQAHSAVFFNSSASVAAACEGIPIFADDQSCVSWSVANHDVSQIESAQVFDRTQWIHELSAAHWSDQEGQRGDIYQRFLPYLK
jgi:hypothetical protein